MEKRLYVDIHVLQTVPPSCVNRDDTGSPKTAVYGGVTRARVSSQAWKYAMREAFRDNALFDKSDIGKRTKKIQDMIAEEIKVLDSEKDADKLAQKVVKYIAVTTEKSGKTSMLIFVSNVQIKKLAELAVSGCDKASDYKEALKNNPSVDIVLFGRMIAIGNNETIKDDAASQVAHSISTHAVQNEYDYFTAVDDLEEKNAGAAHIATTEYNSSTLYRYATVNVMELERQLGREKAAETVKGFTEAFICSMPTGKQNPFANRTLPDAVYVTIREDQPINLCGAFEKAVPKSAEGYVAESKRRLKEYAEQVYETFADVPTKSYVVGTEMSELGESIKLQTLLSKLENAVMEILDENEVK